MTHTIKFNSIHEMLLWIVENHIYDVPVDLTLKLGEWTMLQEITMRQIDDYFTKSGISDIDELGAVDRQIKDLEAIKAKLKARILSRGIGTYEGSKFVAEVQEYDRAAISPVLVKEFGTTDFVQQVTQVQHIKAVVVKPID